MFFTRRFKLHCRERWALGEGKRYGIGEWFGHDFLDLDPADRVRLANLALGDKREAPSCPFQDGLPRCSKKGGVCSLRRYANRGNLIKEGVHGLVVTCPKRFEHNGVVLRWLVDILRLDPTTVRIAREVPFMANIRTGTPAGRIDLVLVEEGDRVLKWHGLEVQAVYFSGLGMETEFLTLASHSGAFPPFPQAVRRPDWRSSSAKRLLPQLQIKGPTLRRWGAKLAVCVDAPFFESIGGASPEPRRDIHSGDIVWMVPELLQDNGKSWQLRRGHWEVLTLEETAVKLRAARTIPRSEFEAALLTRLREFPVHR